MTYFPGTMIISDALNMRGQRSKVTELWLKCPFVPFIELRMWHMVSKLDRKDLNSEANIFAVNHDRVKGQIQRSNINELWLKMLFLAIPSSRNLH